MNRWHGIVRACGALCVVALTLGWVTPSVARERAPLNRLKALLAARKVAIGPILQIPSAPVAARSLLVQIRAQ